MNLPYNLKHKLIASLLLLNLFLQGCGGDSNPIITTTQEKKEKEKELKIEEEANQFSPISVLSDLDQQFLINKIKEIHNIQEGSITLTFEPTMNGIINNVFIVKAKNEPVLAMKCYRSKNYANIKRQINITEKIREGGLPLPKIHCVFKNAKEKNRPIVCSEYCKGTHKELNDQTIKQVANLMAQLHGIPAPEGTLNWQITKEEFAPYFTKLQGWSFTTDLMTIFGTIKLDYLSNLPNGLIHGDLSISNLIFDEKDQVKGILDFDEVCQTYLLTDLTYAQVFHGFDQDGNLQEDKIVKFLRAYNRTRKLQNCELENFYNHLKLLLILNALIIRSCVVDQFIQPERFNNSKSNHDVQPEVLAQKAISLRDRSAIKIAEEE